MRFKRVVCATNRDCAACLLKGKVFILTCLKPTYDNAQLMQVQGGPSPASSRTHTLERKRGFYKLEEASIQSDPYRPEAIDYLPYFIIPLKSWDGWVSAKARKKAGHGLVAELNTTADDL